MLALSNLVHPDSPRGGEEDFTVLEERGTIRDLEAEGKDPRTGAGLLDAHAAVQAARGAARPGTAGD